LNWLDIVILIVIALFSFGGLKNGIIRTALSLAGLLAGIMLAGRYYPLLAPELTFISDLNIANIAAFIIILIAVLIATGIAAWVLTHFAKAILLGWLNALLGGVFGFIMGVITTSVLLTIWVKFRGPSDAITESNFAAALLGYFPFVLSLLPEEFGSIRDFFR
jgi:membrane protein required for colicin V production